MADVKVVYDTYRDDIEIGDIMTVTFKGVTRDFTVKEVETVRKVTNISDSGYTTIVLTI